MEAVFLGTWLSPVEFARQYASNRKPEGTPSMHIQFESGLAVTGSNADARIAVGTAEMGVVAAAVLKRIAHKAGVAGVSEAPELGFELNLDSKKLDAVAEELWKHRGQGLVVSGYNDVAVQMIVNALNAFLGNIGKTIDLARPSLHRSGDDPPMAAPLHQINILHVLPQLP